MTRTENEKTIAFSGHSISLQLDFSRANIPKHSYNPGRYEHGSAGSPADTAKALQYFAEAKALSDKDDGTLWKVPLCGPLLFVDPGTRSAVANQADAEGRLKPLDGVFAGTAPPELGVANTAMKGPASSGPW